MRSTTFGAFRVIFAGAAATALAIGLSVVAAGAGVVPIGAAPLTIVKTVSGPVPAGTTFTATIACDDDIIVDGGSGTDTATVDFAADGQPTTPDTLNFEGPGSCTVTESATGGAATTTYACEGTVPAEEVPAPEGGFSAQQVEEPICPSAGPQAQPISVNIEFEDQTATVTIANTFVEPTPQPAAEVVAQPAFTG